MRIRKRVQTAAYSLGELVVFDWRVYPSSQTRYLYELAGDGRMGRPLCAFGTEDLFLVLESRESFFGRFELPPVVVLRVLSSRTGCVGWTYSSSVVSASEYSGKS